MPQCSGSGGGGPGGVAGVEGHAPTRSSFVDKIHGITDKLHHSLGGHLSHDPSKTGELQGDQKHFKTVLRSGIRLKV